MSRRAIVSIFVLVGALSALTLHFLSPRFTPFMDDDSAEYLEAADNFAAGRGFSVWPYGVDEDDDEPAPLATFPPGYPFLIFLVSRFGLDAWSAGILVPKLAFLLLPSAFFLALRGFFGDRMAVVLALFSAFFSLYVEFAMFAMSELPFLLFNALGFAALFRTFEGRSALFAVAAGMAAAVGLSIRNAGYAVPAAAYAGLAAAFLFRMLPRRRIVKVAALYAAGFAAAYAPVVIRNLRVFGSLQPYDMGASDRTLHQNLYSLAHAVKETFFTDSTSMRVAALILLLFLAAGLLAILRRPFVAEPRSNRPEFALQGLVLALYGVLGVSLVVAARTHYFWEEEINPRHLVPVTWLMVAWSFFTAREWWARRRILVGRAGAPALGLFLLVLARPQASLLGGAMESMVWERKIEARARSLEPMIRSFPEGTRLVSSWGSRLQLLFRIPVRNLREETPEELAASPCGEQDMVLILLGDEDWIQGTWHEARRGKMPEGYRVLRQEGDVLVLFRARDETAED